MIFFLGFLLFLFVIGLYAVIWRAFKFQESVVKKVYDAMTAARGMKPEEWAVEKRRLHALITLIQDAAKREELRTTIETYWP